MWWVNARAKLRVEGYTRKFKTVHEATTDLLEEHIDPEVAMSAGEGLKNGSMVWQRFRPYRWHSKYLRAMCYFTT